MKIFVPLFFLLFSVSVFSQEIEMDSIPDDTLYFDNDYYDNYSEEDPDESDMETSSWGLVFMDLRGDFPQILDKNSFNRNLFGFDFGVFKQMKKNSGFHFGGGVSWDFYGGETFTYFDYSPEDGYEYQYQQSFSGSILSFYLGSKFFSPKSYWIFNPYVNFDIEFRYAYAYYNITNLDLDYIQSTEMQEHDNGFGYNLGIGSLIYVKSDRAFLDISASYKTGGGLFLYEKNPENIVLNSVMDFYDYKFFPINFLTVKFGVVYRG
ncbi:MAG TPA: hypothetical protein ENK91_07800 [Bacteroidetes bacterium]|nr:hypothetical protein [Bacteroidota bacterium]